MRQAEARAAMEFLGIPDQKLIFLGYPDYGTLVIFLKYWEESRPFKDMLTRISKVPYEDALSPDAPYKGEAVLKDIESILKRYKPTKIFVTSPVDTNRDHRALYLFMQVALWNLEGDIPAPEVYPYIVHCYNWPMPRNYHPELFVSPSQLLKDSRLEWLSHKLPKEDIEKKYEAICMYKSQCAVSAFYLKAFARRNELFCNYPVVDLSNMDALPEKSRFQVITTFRARTIAYGKVGDYLMVNMFMKKEAGKARGFYVNLAGYRPGTDFSQMPKIRIDIPEDDDIYVQDRGKLVKSKEVTVEKKENAITVKIPLKILGGPKYILASVNTYTANFPSDLNAWRVIELE
jgi:LmbE family N-acetylglucosaminyl deacetylase